MGTAFLLYNGYMSATVFLVKDLIFIVFLITIAVLAWAAYKTRSFFRVGADAVAAGVAAIVLSRIAGKLYYDPRPFVKSACQAVVPHAADNGFPSDHTLLGAALAAILWRYSRLWSTVVGLLTVVVGWARVYGCIHSPIDIIGAFVIGVAGALIGRWLVDRVWPKSGIIEESA